MGTGNSRSWRETFCEGTKQEGAIGRCQASTKAWYDAFFYGVTPLAGTISPG